ncbi:MAG: sigma-70 family RNA polymerase sigma factor [Desulfobacterales bacterium]|nr:sigma-70 family RNA polymerase sigma factor [Desulfobacterales bacterium]
MTKRLSIEEEQQLLDECINHGNCDELIRQYWRLVRSIVVKTFRRKNAPLIEEDIEDVCQNVFVRLFSRGLDQFDPFKPGSSLTRWIILISSHTTLDYLDKKGFGSIFRQKDRIEFDENDFPKDNVSELINKLSLIAAAEKLTQADLMIFKLWWYGFSAKKISELTGITSGSVNNRISRIRKKIKELI